MMGLIAWNTALEPPEKRSEALAPLLESFGGEGSPAAFSFLELVGALIRQKETEPRLAQDRRGMLNFILTETPTGGHLQVLSALPS